MYFCSFSTVILQSPLCKVKGAFCETLLNDKGDEGTDLKGMVRGTEINGLP